MNGTPIEGPQVILEALVGHSQQLPSATPLNEAYALLASTGVGFLGVVEEGRLLGVASGSVIAGLLSMKFGRALFDRHPLGQHVLPEAIIVDSSVPLKELLRRVSERAESEFYDDVALVSPSGGYIGMIPVHRLVRLQTEMLLDNLTRVEAQGRELTSRNNRIEQDLRVAREVQLALLPAEQPCFRAGTRLLRVRHVYEPAELMGGDFYSILEAGPGLVACGVFDVMGHGVKSALVTAILRALVEEAHTRSTDPGEVMTQINRALVNVLRTVNEMVFVTALIVVFDLPGNRLHWAHAGHELPLLQAGQGAPVRPLPLGEEGPGPALGLLADFAYSSLSHSFSAGESLLLYTDGIIENANPKGEEFGLARLIEVFEELGSCSSEALPLRMLEKSRKHGGREAFADDTCLVLIKCTEEGEA